MDTSEYTTKAERKGARKVTCHPVFQKMRERALTAEEALVKMRRSKERSANKLEAAQQEIVKLKAELEETKLALEKAAS